jgi:hypothetical protein
MRCTLLRGKKGVFLYFILLKYVRGAAFSKSNDLLFGACEGEPALHSGPSSRICVQARNTSDVN